VARDEIAVGLDIGTTKVCTVVGHGDADGKITVTGMGLVPSRGMRKGVVIDVEDTVAATLRFKNDKASGLGIALPAGRVRMFDGKDFLGEAPLGHTAAGQDVALTIGEVFDLKAERKREDFQLDRAGRTMSERISITLRNAKPQAANVRVTASSAG